MSYMNPDTDPFGITYTLPLKKEEIPKEYTFNELKELHNKGLKKERELRDIQHEKRKAMEYLLKEVEKCFGCNDVVTIKDSPYLKCYITTNEIDLNNLKKVKNHFNLKNVKVFYEAGKIKIELIW